MTTNDRPIDYAPHDDEHPTGRAELEENVLRRTTWIRLLYMILYGFLYGVSRLVTVVVVVVQFFTVLFTGRTNPQLRKFGHSLAIYSYEIVSYLTFNTETKPFPLDADWPTTLPAGDSHAADDGTGT